MGGKHIQRLLMGLDGPVDRVAHGTIDPADQVGLHGGPEVSFRGPLHLSPSAISPSATNCGVSKGCSPRWGLLAAPSPSRAYFLVMDLLVVVVVGVVVIGGGNVAQGS